MHKKLFTLFSVLLISCSGNSISKSDVELFMYEYFEKTRENDYSLIELYYSDDFYIVMDRDKWEELYYKIHSILGELITFELVSWNIKAELKTSGSGKNFTFVYKNKYENGDVTETINLFVPRGTTDIKINGHNYTSDVFLRL